MPSGDSTRFVLDAFVSVLRADAGVRSVVGEGVYRDLPGPEASYPLVCVGEVLRDAWDDDDCEGSDLQIELRCYAKGANARSTADMLASYIVGALNYRQGLTVVGHQVMGLFIMDTRTTRDEAQATATVRVRILTSVSG